MLGRKQDRTGYMGRMSLRLGAMMKSQLDPPGSVWRRCVMRDIWMSGGYLGGRTYYMRMGREL